MWFLTPVHRVNFCKSRPVANGYELHISDHGTISVVKSQESKIQNELSTGSSLAMAQTQFLAR